MEKVKFYQCSECKQIIQIINNSHAIPVCHNNNMELLKVNTIESVFEKHIPIIKNIKKDDIQIQINEYDIQVGSVPHPMILEHHIEWILVVTDSNNFYFHKFNVGDEPKHTFCIPNSEKIKQIYEHCNIHGLYLNEI
jgi:superoxide reductase